jgi:hypothetical protein
MSSAKRKREEQKKSYKRLKLGSRLPNCRRDDVDLEEFKGSRPLLVVQQASKLPEENVPEEGKRMERGQVHLGNLKDECPIKPVKDQPSRYKDIILFLHENRTPKQFTLNGDEELQGKSSNGKI